MKKLLSLLTISTLTTSIPVPLLANTTLTRVKRNVSSLTSNANNAYLPLKEINGVSGRLNSIAVDSKDNIYLGIDKGAYVLKQGSTTPTKINGVSGRLNSIAVDSKGNGYFGTDTGAYVLKQGSTTPTKINGIDKSVISLAVDNRNNIYYSIFSDYVYKLSAGSDTPTKINSIDFAPISIAVDSSDNIYLGTDKGAYVLKQGSTTPTKINGVNGRVNAAVDSKDNIYFGTNTGAYFLQTALSWVKTNINVNLIDKAKNIVWLRDDQLIVNGQVKVKIANTDIETVKVSGKEMPQTMKVWEFDLPTDSTTVENKDYQIEIAFKIDGKSYTGQIIVSSLLAQPSITVQKNTSLFGNVASYVYQVSTNDKVGDIILTSDLYYSDTEVKVSLNKPTSSTNITAQIFGLDEKWEKNKKVFQIFDYQTYNLDGSQLDTYQGRYLIETEDNTKNKSSYYVVINKDNLTPNFWDTEQGQTFYNWVNLNDYNESIKKLNATELNKIINESKNWQQLASDSQFASEIADWLKTNGKLSSKEPLTKEQVVAQLKTQIQSSIKIPDLNTSNYDVNKVSFVLNQSEFKPNAKVNITVKYDTATSEQFTLQIKDSNAPNKKGGLTGLVIVGIVLGSLVGLALLGWLFKRFVVDPFILKPIRQKKEKAFVAKTEKDIAQMKKDDEEWEEKQKGDK